MNDTWVAQTKTTPSFCDFLLLLKRRPVGVYARSPEGRSRENRDGQQCRSANIDFLVLPEIVALRVSSCVSGLF